MKPVRKLSSYVLLIGILGLSMVGGVVAYQIYSASVKSQTTTEQATAIKPLDGVINETTVDNLKARNVYSDELLQSILTTSPTPTQVPATPTSPVVEEEAPVATESAQTM